MGTLGNCPGKLVSFGGSGGLCSADCLHQCRQFASRPRERPAGGNGNTNGSWWTTDPASETAFNGITTFGPAGRLRWPGSQLLDSPDSGLKIAERFLWPRHCINFVCPRLAGRGFYFSSFNVNGSNLRVKPSLPDRIWYKHRTSASRCADRCGGCVVAASVEWR